MASGTLIALEGIDGAGTTTQAHRLVKWFQEKGQRAHFTCEPSSGPVGSLIRELLRGTLRRSMDPAAIALLFAADRVDHLQAEIIPLLRQGCHVVTDRYLYSSLAYQSVAQDLRWVQTINRLAPPPHLTIYLQVSPTIAQERRVARGQEQELFEDPQLQQQIAANYDQIFAAPPPAAAAMAAPQSRPWPADPGGPATDDTPGSPRIPLDPEGIRRDPRGSEGRARIPRLLVLDGGAAIDHLHQLITSEVQKVALRAGS